ncbi:MAG: hypothetical protein PF637_08195 [Spirochaetes bacterium]|nr:hypothetical protein [Spirochaetota bacterium]
MTMENQLQQVIEDCVKLSEEIYLGSDKEDIEKSLEKLVRVYENIETGADEHDVAPLFESLLNTFNAEFCSLYSQLSYSENGEQHFYCVGEPFITDSIKAEDFSNINTGTVHSRQLQTDSGTFLLYYFSIQEEQSVLEFISITSSPFSTELFFREFTEKLYSLVLMIRNKSYDYTYYNEKFGQQLNSYSSDLFLFYYNFKNLYKIFNHLGIDTVEDISEYILSRLKDKYNDSIFIYQLSLEKICVFFENETEDKRIIFEYNETPIPYKMKRVLVKGSSKFDKLIDFIAENQ